ncbi:MAG: penicillin-insensitive murein endopeptidase [Paracoccaceae bacterium]
MDLRGLSRICLCLGLLFGNAAAAEPLAKQLFGAQREASQQKAKAHGSYAKGCAGGLVQLMESGPTWQAMRLSRNRNWGHPELVDFVQDLSKTAKRLGWAGLYVGDLSQPRGGPMLSGHRSHQIGLDADIWLYPVSDVDLSRKERENLSAVSMRRNNGAYVNERWTIEHHKIVKAAAKDKRVARIFIFPGAKVQMCNDARGDRSWLRKVRPWWGHHYHFHVRLACPRGSEGCVDQAPPPAGDGCKDAERWVRDILNPPPPDPNPPKRKPRRELVLADLPPSCTGVLKSN